METGVWVAIIAAVQGVTVALILSTRRQAKQANDQLTNSHETNLRDDLDQKHGGNLSRFGRLERRVGAVEKQTAGTARGVQRIEDHLGIEHTVPRPPNTRRKT